MTNVSQDSPSPGQDLNLEPSVYEAEELRSRHQCLLCFDLIRLFKNDIDDRVNSVSHVKGRT
jgi:hypothetical protein